MSHSRNSGSAPITAAQRAVIHRVVRVLDRRYARYQITGGLAGNLHGSRWPLHDIDIDIAAADLPGVLEDLDDYIVRPPARYVDDEFDIMLAVLDIEEQRVDFTHAEDSYVICRGERILQIIDLGAAELVQLDGLAMRVQPLAELIAYKELIGRTADVADLRTLLPAQARP